MLVGGGRSTPVEQLVLHCRSGSRHESGAMVVVMLPLILMKKFLMKQCFLLRDIFLHRPLGWVIVAAPSHKVVRDVRRIMLGCQF